MFFDLLEQTETKPKENQNFDFNLGNSLRSLFEQQKSSVKSFAQPQQPTLAPAIDLPNPIGQSSGFIQPNFNGFQNSQSRPRLKSVPFPEIKLPNPNSGSRPVPFPEIKIPNFNPQSRPVPFPEIGSLDSDPNPLVSFFDNLDQDRKPISPFPNLERQSLNNPFDDSTQNSIESLLTKPDQIRSLDGLSLEQILNPAVDRTHKLIDGLSRDEIENNFLKKLSFVPRQKNNEPSTHLDLIRGANNPEQVAGLGWEFLKRIIGKKRIEKAFEKGKELLKPSAKTNKPKKENKQQEPITQKPSTRTVDPKSKDFIQNNSKEEIAKSISQTANELAKSKGIEIGSEQYEELAKGLWKTWKEEKRHPKYWPITNPKTGTKEFGVLPKSITEEIHNRTGKEISPGQIQLPIGHSQIGKVKLQEKHLDQYKKLGFNTVEEYVGYVGENYGEVYENTKDGRLVLIRRNGKANNLVLELSRTEEGIYNIISAYPQRPNELNDQLKNGRYKLLWRK
jgi:hypothetical protein